MGVSPRFFGMSRLVTFLILLSAIVVPGYPGQPLMKASLAPDDTKMEVHPGYGGLSPRHLNPKITHDDLHHFSAYNLRKAHPGNGGLSPGHLNPKITHDDLHHFSAYNWRKAHPGNGGLSPGHLNHKITHDDLHHFSAYNLRKAHPGNGGPSPGHLTPCGMRMCQCKGGRHWFQ